jgi:hypothetical protein
MSSFCTIHRVPRAGVDPIDSERAALAVINMVLEPPLRHDTVVITLDRERRGRSLVVVHETELHDALFGVLDMVVGLDDDELDAFIVATVRPPVPGVPDLDFLDVDRWILASELVESSGLELVEWFVVGAGVSCPRKLLPDPPRWTVRR